MKTNVKFIVSSQYGEYKIGEKGYVDGYVSVDKHLILAIVVKDSGDIVSAPIQEIIEI